MEQLDLSTYSKQIKDSYEKVVTGAAERYAIFTIDKSSALTASEVQDGDITDFVEEFEDGKVQFGLAKISAPGSDVKKIVLLGWCPDNSPLKSKVSFGANFGEVSKILRGYHVQITARDRDDLDVADILKTVSDASGARYSIQTISSNFKPSKPAVSKPVKQEAPKPIVTPLKPKPLPPLRTTSKDDEDEWDGEEETEVRDFDEKPLKVIPGAYKPVKVDIDSLRKGKNDTISSTPTTSKSETTTEEEDDSKPKSLQERMKSYTINDSSDGRLSSLPKPKVTNSVTSRYHEVKQTSFGTKPPAPVNSYSDKGNLVGGVNRDFGAKGGKTPAQIWAEKHGNYKTVEHDEEPVNKADIESDYVVVPSKVNTREDDEEKEEPVRRSIPPPPQRQPEPESEPEAEPEEEEEPEEEPEVESEPEASPAPSLPTRDTAPAPSLPTRETAPAAAAAPAVAAPSKSISAIAEYEYSKDESNEISFNEGELIIDIEFIDDDWWSGKNSKTGETGLFPASYVTIVESENVAEPTKEEKSGSGKVAIAEYDYDATEDNELTFKEGDLITDIEFIDEDWWLGTLDGVRNLFPANYVNLKE